jgi:uncharacterized damage-inducible protein DinB
MFRTVDDFLTIWKQETESTLKVMRALTDESLSTRVTPDGRSLGFLAWHIATPSAMCTEAGLPGAPADPNEPQPANLAGIIARYEADAPKVAEVVKAAWTDQMLAEEIAMYGEKWTRGFTLFVLLAHQYHHRGQMTVLMRQAGLAVPGVCGPSKEEWAAYGMSAQA